MLDAYYEDYIGRVESCSPSTRHVQLTDAYNTLYADIRPYRYTNIGVVRKNIYKLKEKSCAYKNIE